MSSTWIVIAGGGTAGHVIPGLTVAAELVDRGHPPESVHFIGSKRGVEVQMVPAAGFGLTVLAGRGLNGRRVDLANLRAALGLSRAVVQGIREVRRRRPAVLLALGGYASVGGVMGAVISRVPIIVTEQNARASLANRLAGRFARACAVPFVDTDLPRAVLTGNPVRVEIRQAGALATDPIRRAELRQRLGVAKGSTLIAVMSGSLGARSVNNAVIDMVGRLADRRDLVVHHVIGRRDWQTEHAPTPDLGPDAEIIYRAVEYEDHSDQLLAAADLLIGRAGGSTVAELAAIGVPSIVIPLPNAPRDHQHHNAEDLVRAGGAVRIADVECTGERLAALVEDLIDPGVLAEMATAARSVGRPDAAAMVADLCEEHARGG